MCDVYLNLYEVRSDFNERKFYCLSPYNKDICKMMLKSEKSKYVKDKYNYNPFLDILKYDFTIHLVYFGVEETSKMLYYHLCKSTRYHDYQCVNNTKDIDVYYKNKNLQLQKIIDKKIIDKKIW